MPIQSLRPRPTPDRPRSGGPALCRGPARGVGVADRGCAIAPGPAPCIGNHPEGVPLMAKGPSPVAGFLALARPTNRRDLAALHPGACFRVRQARGFRNRLCIDNELIPVSLDRAQALARRQSFAATTVAKWVATIWLTAIRAPRSPAYSGPRQSRISASG